MHFEINLAWLMRQSQFTDSQLIIDNPDNFAPLCVQGSFGRGRKGTAAEIEGTPIALYCFPSCSVALNVFFRLRSGQHHCNVLGRGGGGEGDSLGNGFPVSLSLSHFG